MLPELGKKQIALMLGLAALYWAGSKIGLYFSNVGTITLIWPPAGLSLAALIIFGRRLWPGVLLGALVAAFLCLLRRASRWAIRWGQWLARLF